MSLDAPPVLSVSEAAEAERNAVLAHTHAIWGGKRTLEKYRQACSELLETPWGRKNYRFYVGKDAAGQVVTACKIYDLDMWAAGRVVRTIGFGAVFTLPEARRQGYAARMLQSLMQAHAQQGHRMATLFSAIDPVYYERLGFVRLPTAVASSTPDRIAGAMSPAAKRSSARFRAATPQDAPALTEMSRALSRRHSLAYLRQPDQLPFHVKWRDIDEVLILEAGGRSCGFLVGNRDGDHYKVMEGGTPDPTDTSLWLGALGRHAASGPTPATEVGGWLPPEDEQLRAAFTWQNLKHGAWMAAPLGTGAPDIAALVAGGAHCYGVDYF